MEDRNFPQAYAVVHTDENVRIASRSGGVFTALSDEILKRNGVIYGVVLRDNIVAEHMRAVDSTGRDAMRG
ncbi:MAG: coenzyme F420 hydrogenase, partial [Parasporobacterium sp.]|nr:coenzyme F420 hydrogenase [Parasporobacterium sp.]